MATPDVYVATESAVLYAGGEQFIIHKNTTRVRAGHPLLKRHQHMFKALDVDYDVEQATKEPGERRGNRRRTSRTDDKADDGAGGDEAS